MKVYVLSSMIPRQSVSQMTVMSPRNSAPGEFVTLRSGAKIPLVGFGTYNVKSSTAINDALDAGYRMFDTAAFYENEWLLGDCLARCNINEHDLFVVSKVWNEHVYDGPAAVRYQIAKSLQDLRVDCIDLYMIHWPVPGKFHAIWPVLEEMVDEGKIRDLGISNFTIEDYEELLKVPGLRILPSVIQIEVNPFLYRAKTISYFKSKGLHIMSYRGFAQSTILSDPDTIFIAEKHKVTPSQVAGRFLVQQNIIHIPKSQDIDRMKENMDVFSFALDDSDIEILSKKTTAERLDEFKNHYLSRRVKDTHLEYKPPKETPFTLD